MSTKRVEVTLVLVALAALPFACSTSSADCVCETNAVKLACDTRDCINGEEWNCSSKAQLTDEGACTAVDAAVSDDGGAGAAETAPPDTSCSDLATFCDLHCQGNPSAYADCARTAQQGDPAACVAWESSATCGG
jgi:hypothetical protein